MKRPLSMELDDVLLLNASEMQQITCESNETPVKEENEQRDLKNGVPVAYDHEVIKIEIEPTPKSKNKHKIDGNDERNDENTQFDIESIKEEAKINKSCDNLDSDYECIGQALKVDDKELDRVSVKEEIDEKIQFEMVNVKYELHVTEERDHSIDKCNEKEVFKNTADNRMTRIQTPENTTNFKYEISVSPYKCDGGNDEASDDKKGEESCNGYMKYEISITPDIYPNMYQLDDVDDGRPTSDGFGDVARDVASDEAFKCDKCFTGLGREKADRPCSMCEGYPCEDQLPEHLKTDLEVGEEASYRDNVSNKNREKSRKKPRKRLSEQKEHNPGENCTISREGRGGKGPNTESRSDLLDQTTQEVTDDTLKSDNEDSLLRKANACRVCKKSFIYKHTLIRHYRIHTGEKPYTCHVCNETFNQKNNLTRHLRIHTGEKPFLCHVCKKTFTQKNNLNSHLRTHTGEKPFRCQVCGEAFEVRCALVRHLRSHASDKPFTCHVCDKVFMQKFYLNRHMRMHTGEKPYSCHVCGKTFSQDCNLIRHLSVHEESTESRKKKIRTVEI